MNCPGSEHRSHITPFSLVNLWKLSVLPPTIKSGATKLRIAAGILAITEAANQSAEEFRKSGVQITSERYPKIRRLCGVHETQNLILTSSEDYFSFILIVRIYLHLSIEFQDHLAPRRLECTSGAFGGSVSTDGMFGSDQIARHPTDAESGVESWAVIFPGTKPQMFSLGRLERELVVDSIQVRLCSSCLEKVHMEEVLSMRGQPEQRVVLTR